MGSNFHQTLHERLKFLQETFSSKKISAFALACGFIFGLVLFSLSNIEFITTNMGGGIANLHSAIMIALSLLFGINIALLYSKILIGRQSQKRVIGTTSVASTLSILFAGCATCGLTLASYIGLGSLAAFLPWDGIEVNLIAILLLLYSIWKLSVPAACSINDSKKPKK